MLTHGSLFSGSGGFDEAARMNGIKTLWCSEIEPFPIRVLRKNFPNAKQLGNISKVNGGEIEPVDIISGGSPCQDMSIAGKREGLDGSRSSLFHEQIRIVKEMRRKTNGKYPRFMLWENVFGALSSGSKGSKGEDFRCVLEQIVSIAEQGISVPRPSSWGGKWTHAGTIMGNGYSVAWRTFDAQYWGVPQRRRRIYLVADFGGECAPQILFKCQSVLWNPTKSLVKRKEIARDFGEGITDSSGEIVNGINSIESIPIENHPNDSRVGICEDGKCQTPTSRMGTGGGNVPLLMETSEEEKKKLTPKVLRMRAGCEGGGKGALIQDNKTGTIACNNDQVLFAYQKFGSYKESDIKSYGIDRAAFNQGENAKFGFSIDEEIEPTLMAKSPNGVAQPIVNNMDTDYIVRRITPLECTRLQGFPDEWTDNLTNENPSEEELKFWLDVWKEHFDVIGKDKGLKKAKTEKEIKRWLAKEPSDSDKYKLWGNGIALPCAVYIFKGITDVTGTENNEYNKYIIEEE